MTKPYYVYILSNKHNTVLYTGVTNNIHRRIWEHNNKIASSFTSKYNVGRLVYIEEFQNVADAIQREKQIKGGSRKKKIDLIMKQNPSFLDLARVSH